VCATCWGTCAVTLPSFIGECVCVCAYVLCVSMWVCGGGCVCLCVCMLCACACVQPAGNRCLHPAFFIGECVCVCANIYSVCVSMCMQLLEFKCATTRPRTCRYCVGVHVHVCAIVCRVGCTKRFLINKSRALSVVHIRRQSEMAP